jgi:hypothetical protein
MRSMLRSALGGLALALALASTGCASYRTARGEIAHPAAIPLRSFPRIWLARGHLPEETAFVEGLAAHLATLGDAAVRIVDIDELEPARVAGNIPPATVVVLSAIDFREGTETRWTSRPQTTCGAIGCYTTRRSYAYDVPTLRAQLSLTVYDGPTAHVEQRVHLPAREEGREYATMRRRAVTALLDKTKTLVEQRHEIVDVHLYEVDVESVRDAISVLEAGDWTRGRAMLERAVKTQEVRALPREERARAIFDLGQARRFDPSTQGDLGRHFAAAERALAFALRLHPTSTYERALLDLRAHRHSVELARAQEEAAEHNYRVGEGIPEPPPAYGDRNPPPSPAPAPTPAPETTPTPAPAPETTP